MTPDARFLVVVPSELAAAADGLRARARSLGALVPPAATPTDWPPRSAEAAPEYERELIRRLGALVAIEHAAADRLEGAGRHYAATDGSIVR